MDSVKLCCLLVCFSILLVGCGGSDNVEPRTRIITTPTPVVATPLECMGPYPFDPIAQTLSTRPTISLNGDTLIQLQIGDVYEDPGATASDSKDGDISSRILVTGLDSLDTSQIGDHLIRYNTQNSDDVTAREVVRIVRVSDTETYAIQTKRNITDVSAVYGYFEHLPPSYSNDQPLPLIIYNHGIAGAANFDHTTADAFSDTGDILDVLLGGGFPGLMRTGNWDDSRQFIILSPQRCLGGVVGEALRVNDFIQYALQTYNIDPQRIYMVGFSAGAFVTWVHEAAFPGELAALVAIAGGTLDLEDTCAVKNVPSWTFHAEDDGTVPVTISTQMNTMLNDCEPAPLIRPRLTLYAEGGHLVENSTLDLSRLNTGNALYDIYDQPVYDWLLSYSVPE